VFIILFYIMACQTGLIYLEPEERFTQLCQNVGLLCSALPMYIHNIIRPLLTYSTYFDRNSLKWYLIFNRHYWHGLKINCVVIFQASRSSFSLWISFNILSEIVGKSMGYQFIQPMVTCGFRIQLPHKHAFTDVISHLFTVLNGLCAIRWLCEIQ